LKSLIDAIKGEVNAPRADDHLHFSTDLQNPRHTCISWVHGVPFVDKPWMNTFPLLQGTAVHEYVHTVMLNEPGWNYISEKPIKVTDRYYPWTGTADAYLTNPAGERWLVDYKTVSGTSLSFMDGPKPDHIMQVSAYYHFGPTIPNMRVGILYLPSSPDYKRHWSEPIFYEIEPLSLEEVTKQMSYIEECIYLYTQYEVLPKAFSGEYVWKKKYKYWQLVYKPHYTNMFCPWQSFADDPCGCSNDTYKVVAEWKKGTLSIEEGYDKIVEDKGMPDEVLAES
jgi:hypothetical protein